MMQGNGRKVPGTGLAAMFDEYSDIPAGIPGDILLVFRCIPLYIYIYTHTLYYTYIPIVPLFLLNHHILEAPQADVCWITTLLVTHWPRSPVSG